MAGKNYYTDIDMHNNKIDNLPDATENKQPTTLQQLNDKIAALVNSAPATLDTLNELATALGDDPNFATTITNLIAAKAPLVSPTITGNPTINGAEPVVTTDPRLTDSRPPLAHKSTHGIGGNDTLLPSDIGAAPTENPSFTGTTKLGCTPGTVNLNNYQLTLYGNSDYLSFSWNDGDGNRREIAFTAPAAGGQRIF
ncbi:hypothetical protein Ga0466249_002302 [Sporomusaceae bacterium BoRhaA]|uniref:hypothetical protein n=1 Tax=Pelorhabdus rhamnosifermentans TaxID=2772457 RepID=UPI001C061B02|nr:hypothetical protein [Pelorhabdus rhamnosifermentans]MBU2701188.1 hypothetical protein [Pelorhabdus rhamnosifermentans]